MGIRTLILQKIKEELTNDPTGVGYAGMTNAQKLAALNNRVERTRQVIDYEIPPISRILSGIEGATNLLDNTDFLAALVTT